MAGVLVAVRRSDFDALSVPLIRSIYREVSLSPESMRGLLDKLSPNRS